MIQVIGSKGGYYGCVDFHRKHRACKNRRLLQRIKIETMLIKEISKILSTPEIVSKVSQTINNEIKRRLSKTPDEVRKSEKRLGELDMEIKNLINFVIATGGTISTKEELLKKENEKNLLEQQLREIKLNQPEKLFVMPQTVRARFDERSSSFSV
jgi:hypothetical protein